VGRSRRNGSIDTDAGEAIAPKALASTTRAIRSHPPAPSSRGVRRVDGSEWIGHRHASSTLDRDVKSRRKRGIRHADV
jgi:hypothetical protein